MKAPESIMVRRAICTVVPIGDYNKAGGVYSSGRFAGEPVDAG
jgi:hypothetical protein